MDIEAFPTFPMRPTNGGKLELARPKIGPHVADCKINGWRMIIHLPTLTVWNRKGQFFSTAKEYTKALLKLQAMLPGVTWVDAEGLLRRHKVGCRTIAVIDIMDSKVGLLARRDALAALPLMPLNPHKVKEDEVYLMPQVPWDSAEIFYKALQKYNHQTQTPFYEGVVAKAITPGRDLYQFQKFSEAKETPNWIKHRFLDGPNSPL